MKKRVDKPNKSVQTCINQPRQGDDMKDDSMRNIATVKKSNGSVFYKVQFSVNGKQTVIAQTKFLDFAKEVRDEFLSNPSKYLTNTEETNHGEMCCVKDDIKKLVEKIDKLEKDLMDLKMTVAANSVECLERHEQL